jgi:hypothetical protein
LPTVSFVFWRRSCQVTTGKDNRKVFGEVDTPRNLLVDLSEILKTHLFRV